MQHVPISVTMFEHGSCLRRIYDEPGSSDARGGMFHRLLTHVGWREAATFYRGLQNLCKRTQPASLAALLVVLQYSVANRCPKNLL